MVTGYFVPCVQAPPKEELHYVTLLLRHGSVHWVSHERSEYSVSTTMAAASARRECCYGRCVSQVINSNLLMFLLPVFFFFKKSCIPWLLPSLFREVPQSYLRGCFPGLPPQQVYQIKQNSQLLGCAFFFFFSSPQDPRSKPMTKALSAISSSLSC